jgi:hypothetical protein
LVLCEAVGDRHQDLFSGSGSGIFPDYMAIVTYSFSYRHIYHDSDPCFVHHVHRLEEMESGQGGSRHVPDESPYLEEMLHSDCQCTDLLHVLPVDLNLLEYNLGIAIVGGRRLEYYYRHPHFECFSAVSIFQDL